MVQIVYSESWRTRSVTMCFAETEGEMSMDGKVVLVILAAIVAMAVCAQLFRSFWFALIGGGPLFLGFVVVCIFLLGVFVGSSMKR